MRIFKNMTIPTFLISTKAIKSLFLMASFLILTAWSPSGNQGFHLLEVDELSTTFAKFQDRRYAYVPQDDGKWQYRASVQFDVTFARVLYWNNYVHTEADETQVRTVGWHFFVGLHVTKEIDIFREHHSEHVMEMTEPGKYPLEDSYGIKFKFIDNHTHNSLFGP